MPTGVYKRDYAKIYTKERNLKISKALTGLKRSNRNKLTPEHRLNISKALIGNKNSLGTKRTKEQRERMKGRNSGENNKFWKGDDVSYRELHKWITKMKGNPTICVHCGLKARDWANIDSKYRRNIDDFISLCRSCHLKYDRKT